MFCEHCGRRLHRYKDETFCPDCVSYTALEPEPDDDGPCQLRLIPDGPDHVSEADLPPW